LQQGNKHVARRLGALDLDLAAVALFFEEDDEPARALPADTRWQLLHQRGFCLRSLCRLREAAMYLTRAARAAQSTRDAAVYAATVSSALMSLGQLSDAVEWAERSREAAERSGDSRERVKAEVGVCSVHLLRGCTREAEAALADAQRLRSERADSVPLLHTAAAYPTADWMIRQGLLSEVREMIRDWRGHHDGPTRGSAYIDLLDLKLRLAMAGTEVSPSELTQILNAAVADTLRRGRYDQLPHVYIECADLRLATGQWADALSDARQAQFYANRDPGGVMRLHLVDCELAFAHTAAETRRGGEAGVHLNRAKRLASDIGYRYRDSLIDQIRQSLQGRRTDAEPAN